VASQFAKFLGKTPSSEPWALAERCWFGAVEESAEIPAFFLLLMGKGQRSSISCGHLSDLVVHTPLTLSAPHYRLFLSGALVQFELAAESNGV
jgi:hypothetical protein